MEQISQQIEALLFYRATPLSKKQLLSLLSIDSASLDRSLQELSSRLQSGATRLLVTENEVELVVAPIHDQLIEKVRREDLKRDIGKAGAETLSIIMYKGQITRAEIDRIRGVNSTHILRNLLVRGLIKRHQDENGQTVYSGTTTLMAHLGINTISELPDYTNVLDALDTFTKESAKDQDV